MWRHLRLSSGVLFLSPVYRYRGYAAGEFPLWSLARFLGLNPIHFEQNVSGQVRLSPKETYAFTSDELMFRCTLIARVRTSGIKHMHMRAV